MTRVAALTRICFGILVLHAAACAQASAAATAETRDASRRNDAATERRSPFFATVVGPDGKALANAEVTCVFTPDDVSPGSSDVTTARTDARGRARCDLLVGRIYAAWAVGKPDETGASKVSRVIPLIAAGRVVVIHAHDYRQPEQLEPTGLEAWRALGATKVRWLPSSGHDQHHDLPWPTNGSIDLPPSPWSTGCLALTSKDGQIMVTARVDPAQASPPTFAAPIKITAVVKDAKGAPLAGASICYSLTRPIVSLDLLQSGSHTQCFERIAGHTDDNGKLEFHAPEPRSTTIMGRTHTSSLVLRASKNGFHPTHQAVDVAGTATFTMPQVADACVRLIGPETDGLRLHAMGSFVLRTSRSSMMFGRTQIQPMRNSNGSWTVPQLERGLSFRALLDSKKPTAIVIPHLANLDAKATIDLTDHEHVDVRVVDATGGLTACAIAVARVSEGSPIYWQATLSTDLAGTAQLRLPNDGEFYVYATTGNAHAMELVTFPATAPLKLALEPLPTMQLRVVDATGAPIAGAHIEQHSSSYHSTATDEHGRQWDRLASHLHARYACMGCSNRDGVLQVPTFLRNGLTAEVTVNHGDRKSDSFKLEAGGKAEIVLGK